MTVSDPSRPPAGAAAADEAPADSPEDADAPRRRRVPTRLELPLIAVVSLVLFWCVQAYLAKPFYIPSASMEPTLLVGDRVLVARFWYRVDELGRGDIVVFHPPAAAVHENAELAEDVHFIKRVVGLPGEWVGGRGGRVWICDASPSTGRGAGDCRALDEAYARGPQAPFAFARVPEGHVFVMGDNRPNSDDSRLLGPIPTSSLVGRAFSTYWPPGRAKALH